MLYEDRVTSFPDLEKRLRSLDQDAGVRLIGWSGRKKFLVFVTRFGPRYTLMTYTMRKEGTPGRRLQVRELESLEGVQKALKKLAKSRMQAWVY